MDSLRSMDCWGGSLKAEQWSLIFFFLAAPCGTQNLSSPGIQPVPPSMEAWSLNHWTIREVLTVLHFKKGLIWLFPLSRFTSNTASRILATREDSVFHNECSKLYSQRSLQYKSAWVFIFPKPRVCDLASFQVVIGGGHPWLAVSTWSHSWHQRYRNSLSHSVLVNLRGLNDEKVLYTGQFF